MSISCRLKPVGEQGGGVDGKGRGRAGDVGLVLGLGDADGLAKTSPERGQEKSCGHQVKFRFHWNPFRFSLDAA